MKNKKSLAALFLAFAFFVCVSSAQAGDIHDMGLVAPTCDPSVTTCSAPVTEQSNAAEDDDPVTAAVNYLLGLL